MVFCVNDFKAPMFEYKVATDGEVKRVDYYDIAQKLQTTEMRIKKKVW